LYDQYSGRGVLILNFVFLSLTRATAHLQPDYLYVDNLTS